MSSTVGLHTATTQAGTWVENSNRRDTEPYSYSPLKSGDIRLFRVILLGNEIVCDMEHFSLEDCPNYRTLSYAWGSGPFSHRICLNGDKYHFITEHLYQGIRSIQPLLSPVWLWIDQICINQDDSEDKASQVALMGEIYANAIQTVVWLGRAYQKSDLAMSHVEGIADLIRMYNFDSNMVTQPPIELGFPSENEQVWPAFQCLFKRPWWKRLWIIQEVIKAKDVVFVAGNLSASYDDFVTLASAHEKFIQSFPDGTYKIGILMGLSKAFYCLRNEVLSTIDQLRSKSIDPQYTELNSENVTDLLRNIITVLEFSRNQTCTIPVDRIYAVLGLIRRQLSDKIKIDYSEENRQHYWRTYLHFHRHLIDTFLDGGYIFTTVFIGKHTASTPEMLPSWCPELVNPPSTARPYTTALGAGHIPSSASWKPDYRMIEPCNSNPRILHVTGIRIDSIKTVIPLWSAPGPILFDKLSCGDATNIKKPLIACMSLAETTRKSAEDLSWMGILFRTWVMNTGAFSDDTYPAETIATDCLAFMNRLTAIIGHQHEGKALNVLEISEEATRYASAFFQYTRGRALFLSESGRFGLCDEAAAPGDELAIWFNCAYPVVQRVLPGIGGCKLPEGAKSADLVALPTAEDVTDSEVSTWYPGNFLGERREQQHRKLIGLCYIDGLMHSEIFAEKDIEKEGYSNFLIL